MKTYLAIAVCLLAVVAYTSAATKCVVCFGSSGDCADAYNTANNNKLMKNCTNGCMKEKTETEVIGIKSTSYARACAASAKTVGCSSTNGGVGGLASTEVTTCYCDGDFCNGSQKMALAVPAFLLALVAALF